MRFNRYLLLFLLAIAVRVIMHFLTGYAVDDAFITFRYAENIAAGNGFVYNLGERVLGTTTPLFTLLLALLDLIVNATLLWSKAISFIASGLTAVMLLKWSEKINLAGFSLLPSLFYIFFPRNLVSDISGMETAFFTLLVVTCFFLVYCKHDSFAIIIGSFAAITRPEGLAALILVIMVVLLRNRHNLLPKILPVLLIVGNWLLFSYLYFTSIIPNSVPAKRALYSSNWNYGFGGSIKLLLGLHTPVSWLILAGFVIGASIIAKRKRTLFLVSLWIIAYTLTLALTNTHIFFWYSAPLFPLIFIFVAIALAETLRLPLLRNFSSRWLLTGIISIVIIISCLWVKTTIRHLRAEMDSYQTHHITAGRYLAEHAGENDVVLAEDIGWLGYIYRGRIIDRDGLVTPQVVPYNRSQSYKSLVDSIAADWLFISENFWSSREIVNDPEFFSKYQVIRRLDRGAGSIYLLCLRRKGLSN